LTQANSATIAQVCTLLDGLPLAIELAAARIKLFSPEAMVGQLNSRLAFLSSRARNLPARQQTLRDTINWSYHLLDEQEKRLFRSLSLFRGGFSPEAAAFVAFADGNNSHQDLSSLALNLLISLSEKNMIQAGQSQANGQPYFTMLSTVREFALEELHKEPQANLLYRRHAQYFAGLVQEAVGGLNGPGQRDWADRLGSEEINLKAALAWFQENSADEHLQILLAYALGEILGGRDRFAEATLYYEQSIRLAQVAGDFAAQARAWNGLANHHIQQGNNRRALEAAEASERIALKAREQGDPVRLHLVMAMTLKGWALLRLGENETALPVAEEAVALCDLSAGPIARLVATNLLAYLYDMAGRYNLAADYYQQALAIARKEGDRAWETVLLNNLAESYKMTGNFAGALKIFEEAYQMARAGGYHQSEILIFLNSGEIQLELGHVTAAEACFRQVMEETAEEGAFFMAYCYALLARACVRLGQIKEADELARKSLTMAQELENPEDIGSAWQSLAEVAIHSEGSRLIIGRRAYSPEECFSESARAFAEAGLELERARLLVRWAGYESAGGHTAQSQTRLQEANQVFTRLDLPLFLVEVT
jgi:tetratricopeptide (TPR) repeat protein